MPTEEELHYKSLINLFKYLVAIVGIVITIITSVSVYYSYHSLNDLKSDVRSELEVMKDEIQSLKDYAETRIDKTQERANAQLGVIKDESRLLAINTTRNKVEESFNESNIQYLIEKTAEKKLSNKLGEIVEVQTSKIESTLRAIPQVSAAYDRARWGWRDREHLDTLYSYSKNHPDKIIRSLANDYLIIKGLDYRIAFTEDHTTKSETEIANIAGKSLKIEVKNENITSLIKVIEEDRNCQNITHAFYVLNHLLPDIEIDNFNFDKVKEIKNTVSNMR